MSANERIANAALGVITGRTRTLDKAGLCLAQVRLIIEAAFGWPSHYWYRWRTRDASDKPAGITEPWARDLEASLRAAGMALDLPRVGPAGDPTRYVNVGAAASLLLPGDLVWRWNVARHASGVFIGHVGVLVAQDLVVENVTPSSRAGRVWSRGPTVLGPLSWPVTTVVRFDPGVAPA